MAAATDPPAYDDLLYADQPLDEVAALLAGAADDDASSWAARLRLAATDAAAGAHDRAAAHLEAVLDEAVESRVAAWAWTGLRGLGRPAPASARRQVLGVVLEVPMGGGADLLAAYADGSARYLHHLHGGVIWDTPDPSSRPLTAAVVAEAEAVLDELAPTERRSSEPSADVRVTALTPAGLRVATMPLGPAGGDHVLAPLFTRATELLVFLTSHVLDDDRRTEPGDP